MTFEPQETGTGEVWLNNRTVNLSSISEVNNQAILYFRIVSAFDPTTNDYRAARLNTNYGANGTSRFDMVTVLGTSLSANSFAKNTLAVYPNPSTNGFVNFTEAVSGSLFNMQGSKILDFSETTQLSLPRLQSGIYFVKTTNGASAKLIIK